MTSTILARLLAAAKKNRQRGWPQYFETVRLLGSYKYGERAGEVTRHGASLEIASRAEALPLPIFDWRDGTGWAALRELEFAPSGARNSVYYLECR